MKVVIVILGITWAFLFGDISIVRDLVLLVLAQWYAE